MEVDCSLPRAICHSCYEDALAAATFRKLCSQSNNHWQGATDYLYEINEPTHDDKAFYLIYNEATVKDKSSRVPDVRTALKRLNSKSLKKAERKSKMKDLDSLACACADCGKKFSSPDYLNYHLRNTSNRACTICGIVMPVKKIVKHLYAEHNIKYVDCKICHQLFDNQQLKLEHEQSHSKGNTCRICGNTYINERALRSHHHHHSLFSCKTCKIFFENIKCFKYHKKKCVNIEPSGLQNFECNECGVIYNRKPSLRIHIIQKHLNVLPYVCQTCGKRASTLNHLKSHLKVHKTERKVFECPCGAKLRTELGFQLHQRIHTGEKPYECEHCGDKFLSSSRRLDHIKRRHRESQDFPHACEKCGARFVRPCELKKHYLSVHCSVVNVLPAKREVNPITKRIRNTYAKIQDDPLIPVITCAACASAALAAHEFRLFVNKSEGFWRNTIDKLFSLPSVDITSVKSMYAVIEPSDLSMQTFRDYSKNDSKTVLNRLNRLKSRTTKKLVERKPRGGRTGPSCSCPDCGKGFLSPHYLNLHLRNSGQKEACTICGTVCFRRDEIKQHLATVHNEIVEVCPQCPTLFTNEVLLNNHIVKCHKHGALTCEDCGRTFPRKTSFDSHGQMHAVRTCRACGVQFINRSCYREHRSQCEPNAKPNAQDVPRNRRTNIRDPATFICDHCGKTYNSRPQLKNHIIWIHMDIRPHQCQWCGKRFYTPARLAEHTVVHTRVRNFECDICGAKLVSKMAAVYHRRRHTGEKPYECEDCGEKFISASRRSEHAKRRHNKGVRLPCSKCPATFIRKHELKKHMEKAHKSLKDEENPIIVWGLRIDE